MWTATASASGIEWLTEMNSQWNGPATWSSPAATSTSVGSIRCSRSLASTSARVNREPTSGMSPRSRSRYGIAPMWSSCPWVRTTAAMSSSRCSMTPKSGRIRSTPGLLGLGEQHAAVDDQQPAVELEDGHVAADLAQPAERHHAQAAGGQRRRGLQLQVRLR